MILRGFFAWWGCFELYFSGVKNFYTNQQILCVHLQTVIMDPFGFPKKIPLNVDFPDEIDLSFLFLPDNKVAKSQDSSDDDQKRSLKYKISACIRHEGSHFFGKIIILFFTFFSLIRTLHGLPKKMGSSSAYFP